MGSFRAGWRVMLGVAIAAVGGCAEPLRFPADAQGGPSAMVPGELFEPAGTGPFPAIVVLHGCGGPGANPRAWGKRLADWGYVALAVDSFGPRGFPQGVCTMAQAVPPTLRARDAFAAASWLRGLPQVNGAHIGVMGFSHGGWTVLKVISESIVQAAGAVPFGAAVAYYPVCDYDLGGIATDSLILMGAADDWNSPRACAAYADSHAGPPHPVAIKLYPGAFHDFDLAERERWRYGHHLAFDQEAAEDAYAMTRRFFDARLK